MFITGVRVNNVKILAGLSKPKLFIHDCAKNSYPHKDFRKLCGCDLLGRWRKASCNVLLFPVVLSMKGKKTMQKGRREARCSPLRLCSHEAGHFFQPHIFFTRIHDHVDGVFYNHSTKDAVSVSEFTREF